MSPARRRAHPPPGRDAVGQGVDRPLPAQHELVEAVEIAPYREGDQLFVCRRHAVRSGGSAVARVHTFRRRGAAPVGGQFTFSAQALRMPRPPPHESTQPLFDPRPGCRGGCAPVGAAGRTAPGGGRVPAAPQPPLILQRRGASGNYGVTSSANVDELRRILARIRPPPNGCRRWLASRPRMCDAGRAGRASWGAWRRRAVARRAADRDRGPRPS